MSCVPMPLTKTKQNNVLDQLTFLPVDEQLSTVERDLLDFFLKSPGIGMITLSFSLLISKTDLGEKIGGGEQHRARGNVWLE